MENHTYYLKNGQFMTGWVDVGSNKYYFGTDGKMVTNKYVQTGGHTYYVDASGRMKKIAGIMVSTLIIKVRLRRIP